MRRTLKNQQGMSLVEATIILLVLMLLTSVLAPSMYDFITDARQVKVKEDCEAIGVSVMRLVRDVGPCLKVAGADTNCTANVMYSDGAVTPSDAALTGNAVWPTVAANIADMKEQFTTNQHAAATIYTIPGWRGAYLPSPIGPDPWGSRYAVNSQYLNPNVTGTDLDVDVFCISGGANKKYETAFNGNTSGGTTRVGDDFIYVIAGSQKAFGQ